MRPSIQRVIVPLLLLVLLDLNTMAAYSTSYCLTSGVTWNSPVTGGFPDVATPEECQLLCTDSSNCDTVTWYGSLASPHPNYCDMYFSPDKNNEVPCTECVSGPESCICSGQYTCSLDSDQLIELLFDIKSEFICAELCFQHSNCEFYSWFSPENQALKDTCALLIGCSERLSSDTCHSGPSNCVDVDILKADYPLCFKNGYTWAEEISRGVPNITSPYTCQEICFEDPDCSGFTWLNSISALHQNFCEFYPLKLSEPTVQCYDCVSGMSACTCSVSDYQTCETSQELVIDILQHIESELKCQDVCARHDNCSWYTWYSEEGDRFQSTCILLESCTKKMQCQGCTSGPDNCENIELMSLPPQCIDYKQLTSYTRNVVSKYADKLCSGDYCCDVMDDPSNPHPPDWEGKGWYKFSGEAGTKMAETLPLNKVCGTNNGGYMVGGHPTVEEGEATRTVYFDNGSNQQYTPLNITVMNCLNFFVYYLEDAPSCHTGYCGE